MPHLTLENLHALREKLLSEKNQLVGELSRIARPDQKEPGEWHATYKDMGDDWDENAQEVTEYATNVSLESSLEIRLREIDRALGRIEKGTYGICEIGGEEIPLARLEANPETTRCNEHAE